MTDDPGMKIRVEVDGKTVWEGECKDGASISLADFSSYYHHSSEANEWVTVDYSENGHAIGVEMLMTRQPLTGP